MANQLTQRLVPGVSQSRSAADSWVQGVEMTAEEAKGVSVQDSLTLLKFFEAGEATANAGRLREVEKVVEKVCPPKRPGSGWGLL